MSDHEFVLLLPNVDLLVAATGSSGHQQPLDTDVLLCSARRKLPQSHREKPKSHTTVLLSPGKLFNMISSI